MAESNDEVETETQTFSHQLSVVTVPLFILQLVVRHGTTACNPIETRLMRKAVPVWTEKFISKAVKIHHVSVVCDSEDVVVDRAYTLEISVSALGLEFSPILSVARDNIKTCGTISCLEHMQMKVMEIVRDSLVKVFQLPSKTPASSQLNLFLRKALLIPTLISSRGRGQYWPKRNSSIDPKFTENGTNVGMCSGICLAVQIML